MAKRQPLSSAELSSLPPPLAHPRALVSTLLEGFDGDLEWLHREEGYAGRPYWPGKKSGVTLDPGFDLGYQTRVRLGELYELILTPDQIGTLARYCGVKGKAAAAVVKRPELRAIRISREAARGLLARVADPYWDALVRRMCDLPEAPGEVQTALLSLAYNRGAANPAVRALDKLVHVGKWRELAGAIRRMAPIPKRRRRESELVLLAADKPRTVPQSAPTITV
jgi:hypothetical protein